MEPRIETLTEKNLAGRRLTMSFASNKTHELWRSFMPLLNGLHGRIDSFMYSVELYPAGFFELFDPMRSFEKWAAVEVGSSDQLPATMEALTIPGGLYAVFLYKGKASEGGRFYQYIFTEWLPTSSYLLDSRPHFALMGDKYKNDDPASEEEIWIPVKKK